MNILCPNCQKAIAISEMHYNKEVDCPYCSQLLFIEEPEDHIEKTADEKDSAVSDELDLENDTEDAEGNKVKEYAGNIVVALGLIIGGATLFFGIIMMGLLIHGIMMREKSGDISDPRYIGQLIGLVCPLLIILLGWKVVITASGNKLMWDVMFIYAVVIPFVAWILITIVF